MVALPVSLSGTEKLTETGFVTVSFTDGNNKNVEFAITPSVTVTPEAQEVDVEKQRYSFEPVKIGAEVSAKLDQLSKVKLELPKLSTSPAKRYLTGGSGSAIKNLPQLDVEQLARLLPNISMPKLEIGQLKSKISVDNLSKITMPAMGIKKKTSSREAIKTSAANKLGDWKFTKTFKVSRWEKSLSFDLNGYRNKVADAVSYAGITIVGIVDGNLKTMFEDEFKDYMNDNMADEINPKIAGLTGAIEDAANAVITFINNKVIKKYNEIFKELQTKLEEILGDFDDAIKGLIGVDKNRDGVPDTGVNALMKANIGMVNEVFATYGGIIYSESERIKKTFNESFGGLEEGMNSIIGNIEGNVNDKFSMIGDALQSVLDDINKQMNKVLTASTANLYANLNLPTNLSIAPAPVRNVTTSSFQVFSNGTSEKPQVIHWVAVGMAHGTAESPAEATLTPTRGGVFGGILDKFA